AALTPRFALLALHGALPIWRGGAGAGGSDGAEEARADVSLAACDDEGGCGGTACLHTTDTYCGGVGVDRASAGAVFADARSHGVDRKSTRLNSSHVKISYAV